MIQNYTTLNINIQKINSLLIEKGPAQVQKIFSSFNYLSLVVRLKGETIYILIGRGGEYQGVWISPINIPSEARVRDRYLEYLRKNLKGRKLESIYLNDNERLFGLCWTSSDFSGVLYKKYKGKISSFVDIVEIEKGLPSVFISAKNHKTSFETKDIFEHEENIKKYFFVSPGKDNDIRSEKEQEFDFEKEIIDSKDKVSRKKERKKEKFFQRKEQNITKDLEKILKWRELKGLIESPDFIIPMDYQFKLLGIKFKIESGVNAFKRKDLFYKKIKAFRNAEGILRKRLEDNKIDLKKWVGREVMEIDDKKIILPEWPLAKYKGKLASSSSSKEIELYDLNGMELGVGRNTSGNDFLRSSWARKSDMWFHLEGFKSSHAILKIKEDYTLSAEDLSLIGSVIRDMGALTITEIPIIFTQVKNLKGIKGQKGSVTYKKEKHMQVNYLKNWREIIA